MPDPGEPFVPEQRDPSRRGELDRAVVEQAIAVALHRQSCGDVCDGTDVAVTDAQAHADDARHVYDELRERGWKVTHA